MTSNGFGYADPPAGFRRLYALLPDCCAIAQLRSAAHLLVYSLAPMMMMVIASANSMTPMMTVHASRSSEGGSALCFASGGGGSRRILDGRSSTLCRPGFQDLLITGRTLAAFR